MPDTPSSELCLARDTLRKSLFRWGQLRADAGPAGEALIPLLKRQKELDSATTLDPESAAWRTAQLEADIQGFEGTRGFEILREWAELTNAIHQIAPVVAAAAEKAGIDSGPLGLFATDYTSGNLQAARLVVERVAARAGCDQARTGGAESRPLPSKTRSHLSDCFLKGAEQYPELQHCAYRLGREDWPCGDREMSYQLFQLGKQTPGFSSEEMEAAASCDRRQRPEVILIDTQNWLVVEDQLCRELFFARLTRA
jgi:hypothetical protein